MNDNSNTASDDENVLETSPRALRRTASLPSLSDNDSVACAKVGLDPIANARSNAILAKAVKHNTAVIARHFLQWEEETKLREEKLKAVIVELSDRITRLEVEVLGKGDEQTDEEDINAPVRAAVLLQGFLSRLDTTEERQGDLEGSQETMTRRMVSVEKQIDVVARANNEKDAKQMDSMKEKVKNLKSAVDSMKEATEVSKGLSTTVKELIDGKASKRQVTDLRAFAMSEIADVEKRVVSKFRQTQPPVNPEASIKSQLGPITDEVRQMTARVGDMESQLQVALAENKALRARLSTMGADDGEVAPEEKLLETVRLCGLVDSTKKIVIATDANARTASESAMLDHPQRVSKDLIKNARGNRLLSLCKESNLVIINGTDLEMPQQGSFTSHQHNGSAVVDYFIVSAGILMTVRQMTVEDIALDPDLRWSDHSQLLLVLSGSAVTRTAIQQEQSVPLIIPESVIDKEADLRYKETLDSAQPPRERLEQFYGPAYYTREPLSVYTDGACSNNGKKEAVAGAGICYGIRSPRNLSLRVPGPGQITNNRAEVFAVLQVLMRESPDRPLLVYTDSQYVIKECCYWAARHLTTGWNIPNGDLLKDVCHLLKLRPASTRFIWVKGHNGTAQNEKADELAKVGLQKDKINDYCSITGPPWMVTLTEYVTEVKERVKVSTDLPENSEIKQTDEKEKGHIKIISHRGRSRVASIQEYNLEKLRKCKTNAQFWMLYKNWLDPKARDFELSLQQLHAEFKARMNESLVPSVQLNHQHLSYVKHLNAMLSEDNVDETEEGFFSRDIEEDDVAEAKEHIWEKNLNSAKGSDQVDFKEILNIPNDKIADFLNWCIRHRRAPSRWLIAVIIGILKQGKNANDPQGYRLIVLECCFAKLLAYIIDRRIRAYC
ncbi:hypothetical protein D9757_009790 [Collybiopsis confluens]|uniref:ribonuclease H n=1 Tax=Collybiopsis confluens TaxID=2823264 RepID=A0A8H5HFJ2_9AGAR|nr:hypothetical protein D9757_009790 [Collybiopsis confluens]